MHTSPSNMDPAAELRELDSLARDVLAHRPELERRLATLNAYLGERLRAEPAGPTRAYALRANRLLPDALYRAGLASLSEGDHARAEGLLTDAADLQRAATGRLRTYAREIPSLQVDAAESERWLWTVRWESTKAMRAQGEWHQARAVLSEVMDHVRLDGRFGLVRKDLDLVDARIRYEALKESGHGVRAALQGLRPSSRRAARPKPSPQGATVLAASASRPPSAGRRPGDPAPRGASR